MPTDKERIADLESALDSVKAVAADARRFWDVGDDMKVGKILKALAGQLPGYRHDIDKIHKIREGSI